MQPSLQSKLTPILDQYIGIIGSDTLSSLRSKLLALPTANVTFGKDALAQPAKNVFASITASATGNTLTALEQLENCVLQQLSAPPTGSTLSCLAINGGPLSTIELVSRNIMEQAVGYLGPTTLLGVSNGEVAGTPVDWLSQLLTH